MLLDNWLLFILQNSAWVLPPWGQLLLSLWALFSLPLPHYHEFYIPLWLYCNGFFFTCLFPPLIGTFLARGLMFSSYWYPYVYHNTQQRLGTQKICFNKWEPSILLWPIIICCHMIFHSVYIVQKWNFGGSSMCPGCGVTSHNQKLGVYNHNSKTFNLGWNMTQYCHHPISFLPKNTLDLWIWFPSGMIVAHHEAMLSYNFRLSFPELSVEFWNLHIK